jgi:hypothetical protein
VATSWRRGISNGRWLTEETGACPRLTIRSRRPARSLQRRGACSGRGSDASRALGSTRMNGRRPTTDRPSNRRSEPSSEPTRRQATTSPTPLLGHLTSSPARPPQLPRPPEAPMPPTRSSSAAAAALANHGSTPGNSRTSGGSSPTSSTVAGIESFPPSGTAASAATVAAGAAPPPAVDTCIDDSASAAAASHRRKPAGPHRRQVVFSPHPPSLHAYGPAPSGSGGRQTRLAAIQQQATTIVAAGGGERGRSDGSPGQQTTGWPGRLFADHHDGTPSSSSASSSSARAAVPPGAGATPPHQPQRGILKRTGSAEIRRARDVQEGTRVNGRLRSAAGLLGLALDEEGGGGGKEGGRPMVGGARPKGAAPDRERGTIASRSTTDPFGGPSSARAVADQRSTTSSAAVSSSSSAAAAAPAFAESSSIAASRAASTAALASEERATATDSGQSIISHLRTILACGGNINGGSGPVVPVSLPDVVESYSALISRFRSLPTMTAAVTPSSSSNGSSSNGRPPKSGLSPKTRSSPSRPPTADAGIGLESAVDVLRPRAAALADALARDLGRFFRGSTGAAAEGSTTTTSGDGGGRPAVPGGGRDSRESSPADDNDAAAVGVPTGRLRKGFTELEVTRRREEVQAGHGAIRLTGALLANEGLWSCFSGTSPLRLGLPLLHTRPKVSY